MTSNSNAQFPMPEVVNSPLSYAPRGRTQQDVANEAVATLASMQTGKQHAQAVLDLRANIPTGVDAIKSWLKTLTHREMREFVAEIFAAHKKLHPQSDTSVLAPAITSIQLADILDTVAHGD